MSEDVKAGNPVWRWLRSVGAQIVDAWRRGVSLAWLAPAIFALIVLPEFAQHVWEIRIGLHDANPVMPTDAEASIFWLFAYAKVTGLVLGMLLAFRFWMQGASLARSVRFRTVDFIRIAIGLAVFALLDYGTRNGQAAFEALGLSREAAAPADIFSDTLLFVPQVLILPWFLAALGSEDGMTLGRSARAGVRGFARLVIVTVTAVGPPMLVHLWLHELARGAAPAPLWALMSVDSLVVGLLGTLAGSAFYVFYRQAADANPARAA
ncbi:MAG: hypothetical protein ACT4N8_01755 [Sphingosinicella sp.]|uniref:hypothetical protein n=1 Tax=Sphingosinicella sp. TaxID=1917971 RepID=UPI004037E496